MCKSFKIPISVFIENITNTETEKCNMLLLHQLKTCYTNMLKNFMCCLSHIFSTCCTKSIICVIYAYICIKLL